MATPVKSPYGARPSQLTPPATPDYEQMSDAELMQAVKGLKMPESAGAPTAEAVPDYSKMSDAELQALVQGQTTAPDANAVPADVETSSPGFIESNTTGLAQQFREAPTRAKFSFAVSDNEKLGVLREKYGPENVKKIDGTFHVKREGAKKFTKFDSDAFELIGDLADWGRESVEMATALPFEIGGAIAGGATGGVGGSVVPIAGTAVGMGAGMLTGLAAGRAAGSLAGTQMADAVAQMWGIAQDPERNKMQEQAIGAGMSVIFGTIGDKIAGRMMAKETAKKLAISGDEVLSETSKRVLADSREMSKAGTFQYVKDKNGKVMTALLPHQIDPNSQIAKQFAQESSSLPEYGRFVTKQAEELDTLMKDTLYSTAKVAGKGLMSEDAISAEVTGIAKTLRNESGKAIEAYRKKAGDKLGNKAKILPGEALGTWGELTGRMGFTPQDLKAANPSKEVLENIQVSLNVDPGQAAFFFRTMKNVGNEMTSKGGMTLDSLQNSIKMLEVGYDKARKAGGDSSRMYSKLTSELRGARNNLVENALPQADRGGFRATMSKFQNVLEAQDNLGNLLTDEIANKTFVNGIMTKGAQGLPRLQAAQSLLQKEHPQVWEGLKGNFLDHMIVKNMSNDAKFAGKLDAAGLRKDIMGLPKEMRNILFEGGDVGKLMDVIRIGERIRDTRIESVAGEELSKQASGLLGIMASSMYMKGKAVLSMINLADDKAVKFMQTMTDEGVDKLLKMHPKKDHGRIRLAYDELVSTYRNQVARGMDPRTLNPSMRIPGAEFRDAAREGMSPDYQGDNQGLPK